MTDITKCHGGDSPLCSTCWRKLAPEHEYMQSWFRDVPLYDGGKCEEYWRANVSDA